MRLDTGEHEDDSLNLTPLIDVVFLLLIFFLVSTTFQRDEVEMGLTLPEASSGVAGEDGHLIVINIKKNGAIYVDGRKVTLEALRQKLEAAARRDRDQEVSIRGDTKSELGVAVRVFDACRLAELTRIAIVAQPEDPR